MIRQISRPKRKGTDSSTKPLQGLATRSGGLRNKKKMRYPSHHESESSSIDSKKRFHEEKIENINNPRSSRDMELETTSHVTLNGVNSVANICDSQQGLSPDDFISYKKSTDERELENIFADGFHHDDGKSILPTGPNSFVQSGLQSESRCSPLSLDGFLPNSPQFSNFQQPNPASATITITLNSGNQTKTWNFQSMTGFDINEDSEGISIRIGKRPEPEPPTVGIYPQQSLTNFDWKNLKYQISDKDVTVPININKEGIEPKVYKNFAKKIMDTYLRKAGLTGQKRINEPYFEDLKELRELRDECSIKKIALHWNTIPKFRTEFTKYVIEVIHPEDLVANQSSELRECYIQSLLALKKALFVLKEEKSLADFRLAHLWPKVMFKRNRPNILNANK